MPCICGATNDQLLFTKKDYDYRACDSCGLVYIYPQPTDKELLKIYEYGYFDDWGAEDDYKQSKLCNFQNSLRGIPSPLEKGAKVLDVGAGTGIFTQFLQQSGFDAYAVELSKDGYAECIKKCPPHKVFNGFFEDVQFTQDEECEKFDFIFMCDFLEHVRNPDTVLSKAASLLKPGGGIAIHVPNVESIVCKMLGKRWEYFATDHLFYYSKASLSRLLQNNGFRVCSFKLGYKFITVDYIANMVSTRMTGGVLSLMLPMFKLVPKSLKNIPIKLYYGEMICYAKRI